ncbi:MAG: acetyl-CoA carboxylase carboxyl transferase subunit beta, partial [Nitrosomonas sp.]|nr:acetyl-CoA carboxylase carboxyl transferase subunit beta [Nitrosomonas sp.]
MSWFQNIIPPKIKRKEDGGDKKNVPEGLWSKCKACEAVLYYTDLGKNLNVCPRCDYHNRLNARDRINLLLDPGGRHEVGAEVVPTDPLKFKDSKRYVD